MKNNVYKSKSFNRAQLSDCEIKEMCANIRFMSFESACDLFARHLNINDLPIGYRVTDQGIEILY